MFQDKNQDKNQDIIQDKNQDKNQDIIQDKNQYKNQDKNQDIIQGNQDNNPNKLEPMYKTNLIGQGTYGCIYKPNIPCKNEKPNKSTKTKMFISKLQRNQENSEREANLGKIIKTKIPKYNTMFAPIIDSCTVNIEEVDPVDIEKCDIVTKDRAEGLKIEYKSYKMRYAGKQFLSQYFLSLIKKSPKKLIKRMVETHIYLLKSLNKLIKVTPPIIHYDLKDNNIMYDEKHSVPIIIDFGLSFELDPNKGFDHAVALEQYYVFYEKYPPWCIELVLLSYIVQKIAKTKEIKTTITDSDVEKLQEICHTFISKNELFNNNGITKDEAEVFKQELYEFVSTYLGKTWETMFKDLQKGYASWDNYSLSVIFLFYIQDLLKTIDSPIKDRYIALLKNSILAIPNGLETYRPSGLEIISGLKHMASNTDKKEYHKIMDSIKNSKSLDPHIINVKLNKKMIVNEEPNITSQKQQ